MAGKGRPLVKVFGWALGAGMIGWTKAAGVKVSHDSDGPKTCWHGVSLLRRCRRCRRAWCQFVGRFL